MAKLLRNSATGVFDSDRRKTFSGNEEGGSGFAIDSDPETANESQLQPATDIPSYNIVG